MTSIYLAQGPPSSALEEHWKDAHSIPLTVITITLSVIF
jgi:hypothetical protein